MASVADLDALRALLDRERAAHIGRDATMFVSLFADDFVNVAAGRITHPTRAESLARFQGYFDQSEFLAWDDVEPPHIRVSLDGTMAYVIVRKRVSRNVIDLEGGRREDETTFAWLEAWERVAGEWKLKAVASTSQPESG